MKANKIALFGMTAVTMLSSCAADMIAVTYAEANKMKLESIEKGLKDGTVIEGKIAIDSVGSGNVIFSENRFIGLTPLQKKESMGADSVTVDTKQLFSIMENGTEIWISTGRPYVAPATTTKLANNQ